MWGVQGLRLISNALTLNDYDAIEECVFNLNILRFVCYILSLIVIENYFILVFRDSITYLLQV